ncbi:TPA: hypothetical protein N5N91_004644 [Enterobacter roggenkampii]|nr:hypothetical protein [Enterobacter roggenkampii]
MFAILLKDRGFPVHLYLQHMMKEVNLSRTDAGKRLSQFAYEAGLRDTASTPLNNTMTDWVRNLKTPQWAVVSCMQLLEISGRVPKTQQEWAFWAFSRIDNKIATDRHTPRNWPVETANYWLECAERYSYWYNRRSEIKQCLGACESPLLAAKLMYHIFGEIDEVCSYPELFFSLAHGKLANEQVASSVRNDVALNMLQVEHVCLNDHEAKKMDESIKAELNILSGMNLINIDHDKMIRGQKFNLLSLLREPA